MFLLMADLRLDKSDPEGHREQGGGQDDPTFTVWIENYPIPITLPKTPLRCLR